jgi:tripartite ATP-independent transporter DctP family solute receptor
MAAFKQAVEAKSGKRIEIQLFFNRALGDEKPMLEGLRFGTVDMAIIPNAVVAQIDQTFQVTDLPFVFKDEAQAHRVLDGPVGRKLAENLVGKGVVVLGYMEGGFRSMANNVRPVNKPEDTHGIKMRVMQNKMYISMFDSLGSSPVPLAASEVFTSLQQGAVDGLEMPPLIIEQVKYNEALKYLSLTKHTYNAVGLLMSKRSFDKLPDDLKQIVRDSAAEATKAQRASVGKDAAEVLAVLAGKGMIINPVSDMAPFRKAMASVYEGYRPAIGSDLVDLILQEVNK